MHSREEPSGQDDDTLEIHDLPEWAEDVERPETAGEPDEPAIIRDLPEWAQNLYRNRRASGIPRADYTSIALLPDLAHRIGEEPDWFQLWRHTWSKKERIVLAYDRLDEFDEFDPHI